MVVDAIIVTGVTAQIPSLSTGALSKPRQHSSLSHSTAQTRDTTKAPGDSATNDVSATAMTQAFVQLTRLNTNLPQPTDEDSRVGHHTSIAKENQAVGTQKEKPWYQGQMEAGNLPTSEISKTAMQVGLEYRRTGVTQRAAKPTKAAVTSKQGQGDQDEPSELSLVEDDEFDDETYGLSTSSAKTKAAGRHGNKRKTATSKASNHARKRSRVSPLVISQQH